MLRAPCEASPGAHRVTAMWSRSSAVSRHGVELPHRRAVALCLTQQRPGLRVVPRAARCRQRPVSDVAADRRQLAVELVHETLLGRRTAGRMFDGRPVPEGVLIRAVEAAT